MEDGVVETIAGDVVEEVRYCAGRGGVEECSTDGAGAGVEANLAIRDIGVGEIAGQVDGRGRAVGRDGDVGNGVGDSGQIIGTRVHGVLAIACRSGWKRNVLGSGIGQKLPERNKRSLQAAEAEVLRDRLAVAESDSGYNVAGARGADLEAQSVAGA